MKVKLNISALGQSQWHEYVARFAFGGAVTALAGVIGKQYGPGVGGLFLAFPAIFPAAATLIQKLEKDEKKRAGQKGTVRSRMAAGADAAGAAMGSVGLMAFAVIVWRWISRWDVVMVLSMATIVWFTVAFLVWETRDTLCRKLRGFFRNAAKH